jgi:hypothetical protein
VLPTLKSLAKCQHARQSVEVLLVFNAAESATEELIQKNEKAKKEAIAWDQAQTELGFELHCLVENNLPAKQAGVGLARKIGMDEAVRRFQAVGNQKGVIVCLDADSQCESNYLVEIEKHFSQQPTAACSIHFEHPIAGDEFPSAIYEGIYWYELHLRYYVNSLRFAKLPFAFHTIGSSMAVRAEDYCKQGGMNRRKAGEDFYFLQKFIDNGNLSELKTTTVIPSPRQSHRVPFGTGRAIQEMLEGQREIQQSYSFESFELLKVCFDSVVDWFENEAKPHELLLAFVGQENWDKKIEEIRGQSTDKKRFEKRFFQWFNAFQTLKFIHFLRDEYVGMNSMKNSVPKLLAALEIEAGNDLLQTLRRVDRS